MRKYMGFTVSFLLGVIIYIAIKHPDIARGVTTPLSFGG